MGRNVALFIAFRVLFNARWYYPIMAVLFLDLGVSLAEFAMLNVIWAISTVVLEVPSGALADQIGRRRMVLLAAWLMFFEMVLLVLAPVGSAWLFAVLALNRALSGAAEASASGADEALAYDSLVDLGREREWPDVLSLLMRWQAAGFFVAMLAGAAVFDAGFVNGVLAALRIPMELAPATTLRLPLVLTLGNAVAVVTVALAMREPTSGAQRTRVTLVGTLRQTLRAGTWMLGRRAVVFIIGLGLCIDSAIRMFLTVNSNYYRLIGLPEASFGVVASGFAIIGFFVPMVSRWLVARLSMTANFYLTAGLAALGLAGVSVFLPGWGVLAVVPVGFAMSMLGFFTSHYLNDSVRDSSMRTTVLSFKGLLFNLSYALVGSAFAAFTAWRDPVVGGDSAFVEAIRWLTLGFVLLMLATLPVGCRADCQRPRSEA